jgi:hypothetical protein
VAVEKLARHKFAEIASRQEALQTISPSRLDFSITRFSTFIRKTDFFNTHRDYHYQSQNTTVPGLLVRRDLLAPIDRRRYAAQRQSE